MKKVCDTCRFYNQATHLCMGVASSSYLCNVADFSSCRAWMGPINQVTGWVYGGKLKPRDLINCDCGDTMVSGEITVNIGGDDLEEKYYVMGLFEGDVDYPMVKVFSSRDELEEWINSNEGKEFDIEVIVRGVELVKVPMGLITKYTVAEKK